MKVLYIGLVAIGGLIVGTVIDFVLKNRAPGKKDEPEMALNTEVLCGTVTEIVLDHERNLTKISVKDNKGHIRYGFSSIPAAHLEHIYMGKGWVQVPILRQERK